MLLQSEWYNQNTPADDSFLASWKYEKMPIFIFLEYVSHHPSLSLFHNANLAFFRSRAEKLWDIETKPLSTVGSFLQSVLVHLYGNRFEWRWLCPSPSLRRPHAPLISITYNHRLTLAHSTAGAWENMKYWHRTRLLDQKTIDSDPSGKTCSGKNLIEILCG